MTFVLEKGNKVNYIYKLEREHLKEFKTKPNYDYFIILQNIGDYDEFEYDILYFYTTKNNIKQINLNRLIKIILSLDNKNNDISNISINKNFMEMVKIHKKKFKDFCNKYEKYGKKYSKIEKIDFIRSIRYYLIYVIGLEILKITNDEEIKNEIMKIFNYDLNFILNFLNSNKSDNKNNN